MFVMVGIVYAVVIFFACVLGAVVGLGGGIFIRPLFDFLGYHSMANIQFFSSAAILSMAIVSTAKKMKDGVRISRQTALLISGGAIIGGILGDLLLGGLISVSGAESDAQTVQTFATVAVLILSLVLTSKSGLRYEVSGRFFCFFAGIILGAVATFLGIGGGPINVPIFMIFFGLSVKEAASLSIVTIFFSHAARIITLGATIGFAYFDTRILFFVIPAAAFGGLFGARFSQVFSDETVKRMFMAAIAAVILLNVVNGLFVF